MWYIYCTCVCVCVCVRVCVCVQYVCMYVCMYIYIYIYIYIHTHTHQLYNKRTICNSSFWFSNLIGWEPFPSMRYSSDTRAPTIFTVCITPLAVFLTTEVMAVTQIHYNFTNNTVMESSLESCLGENLLQKSGLLKDNVYLKICFDVFGDVSSRTSLAEQPYPGQVFWNLPLTLIVVKPKLASANFCAL